VLNEKCMCWCFIDYCCFLVSQNGVLYAEYTQEGKHDPKLSEYHPDVIIDEGTPTCFDLNL
jgi:hypothetical protein